VSNKLFGKQVRGYSMDEVDAFLDEVEAELSRLLTENAGLLARVSTAPAQAPSPATTPAPAAQAPPIAPGEPQEAALRTLLMAQRTADQAIAEAQAEADKLVADARTRSQQVEQEVNARTTAALAELDGRRRELEARIEDLKAFEREYRLRLQAYLESQLKDLSTRGGGNSDGPGAGVPASARTAAVGVMPSGVADSAAARPTPPPPPPPPPSAAVPVPAPAAPAAPAPPAPEAAQQGFPQVLPPEWAELNTPEDKPEAGGSPFTAGPAPSGPPHQTPAAHISPPAPLRAVPPLSVEPEPMGPFTVVPPPVQIEQVDEGPEPPTQR
jgi:DivIVA domain-containing protein